VGEASLTRSRTTPSRRPVDSDSLVTFSAYVTCIEYQQAHSNQSYLSLDTVCPLFTSHNCCLVFGSARQPRTLGLHCYFNTCHMIISHRRPPGRCATSRTRLVWPHIISEGLLQRSWKTWVILGVCVANTDTTSVVLASHSLGIGYLNQNRASDEGQFLRATSNRQILFFINTRGLAQHRKPCCRNSGLTWRRDLRRSYCTVFQECASPNFS
jgi:hypothetical protein